MYAAAVAVGAVVGIVADDVVAALVVAADISGVAGMGKTAAVAVAA